MKAKRVPLKYQKYLLVVALVLSSLAISIRSGDEEITLVLHEYPILIFFLIVLSSFLVAIYFHLNRKKIADLSDQIKEQAKAKGEEIEGLLYDLTERQKEVYDLIIAGKTNKEIMSQLFIEQSTLKSHINQIYKRMNIKNRRELKSKVKP